MAILDNGNSNLNIDGAVTQYTDFGGADTYTILPSMSADVEIIDNNASVINLPAGLDITDAQFLANGVQFTVNGNTLTLLGDPSQFSFVFGGTPLDPSAGTALSFDDTAVAFGTTVPAPGEAPNASTNNGAVNDDGSVGSGTGGGGGGDFALTADADSADEGTTATFTLANGEANTTYNYDISGVDAADIDGGALTGSVTTDADGNATISVALAADRTTEGEETLTVSLPNTPLTASTTVNDTSLDNTAPAAEDATLDIGEGDAAAMGQLVAPDAEGDAVTFALDAPVDGLTVNADGSYTFDPAANPAAQALVYTDDPLVITATYTATDSEGAAADPKTLTITVTPTPLTFAVTTDVAEVEESLTQVFTVTASEAVTADTDITFQLFPGDGAAANAGTNNTNTADFATGAFNPEVKTILAGETTTTFEVVPQSDATTELPEAFSVEVTTPDGTTTLDGTVVDATTSGGAGQTFTLTTGIDTIPGLIGSENSAGTDGDDTINGLFTGVAATNTINPLDSIDGGLGSNTLKLDATAALTAGAFTGVTISNVDVIQVRGVDAVTLDSTGFTGVTSLESTLSTTASLTGAATTDILVSGATDDIAVIGGKDITVTDGTAGKKIEVGAGAAADPAGTVTVTDTNNEGAANTVVVDGGTDVTVTTTATETSGAITIGGGTAPTGAVMVTQNTNSDDSAAVTAGDVTVTGGSTIDIIANITNEGLAADVKADNVTAGTYTATAGDATTSISIVQNNEATDRASVTTGAAAEVATVTFGALAAGEDVFVSVGAGTGGTDLTFTASTAMTAEEVAAAFASLTNADTQAPGGPVSKGTFSGALDAGITSGAASGATVTFTAAATGVLADIEVGTSDATADFTTGDAAANADFKVSTATQGAAGTTVAALDLTPTDGAVVANDNATASVTTVTVDGFNTATLGTTSGFDALTDLMLANGTGAIVLDTAQTSLNLSLDAIAPGSTFNLDSGAATVATLNLTTMGAASDVDFTAGAVTTANITANVGLDVSGGTFVAATTLNVSGAGPVNLGDVSAAATTLAAGGATGMITATVDGTKAEVTTGSGNDMITIDTAGLSKAVNLGDGDDTLILTDAAPTTPTATIDGGAGTNTLSLTSAAAAARDGDTAFGAGFTNFSTLSLGASAVAIDVKNLGFASSVNLAGANTGTLDNLASGATVGLTVAGNATTLNVEGAGASGTDELNLLTHVAGADIDFGDATAANVETINITANDTLEDDNNNGIIETGEGTPETATLGLNAVNATNVNISGSANVTLDGGTMLTALTSLDASGLTGVFTGTVNTNGASVMGGSGADMIMIDADSVTVSGGDGNDVIMIADNADLLQINGGSGADRFDFNGTSTNENNFAVINDIGSGDIIDLAFFGVTGFQSTAVTLSPGATESTQAFLDQAMVNLADGEAGWFTFGGNTFIALDTGGDSATEFVDDTDFTVMLVGTYDLSTGASFNSTSDTIEIA